MQFQSILHRLVLTAALALPTGLAASPLPVLPGYAFQPGVSPSYPGASFDWPAPGFAGYGWLVDITSVIAVPVPVVDFTVTNVAGQPVEVDTFQVFGNCDGFNPGWKPGFDLFVNGQHTAWTSIWEDPCNYHNYFDVVLPVGDTRFTVLLNDMPGPDDTYVDVRFGNVIPAVPLPAPIALLIGAIVIMGTVERRRLVPAA